MKKLFTLLALAATLAVTTATAAEFVDVPTDYWAYNTISELADKGIINGIAPNTYAPAETITRAQFVKLIVCALENYDSTAAYPPVFNDTAPEAWYTPYVTCGVYSGVIKCDTDDFLPNTAITRGEAALCMINGLGVQSDDAVCKFSDVTDSEQKKAVGIAAEYGLITGYDDGTFRPNNTLTRAEASALVSRMLKKTSSFHELRKDSANEVIFKDSVKYAESGNKNKITDIDTAKKTIKFSNADDTIKSLKNNDVLYMPESTVLPEGLIAKITNIKVSGNTVTLTCAQPDIEDVIDSIDISTIVTASSKDFKANNIDSLNSVLMPTSAILSSNFDVSANSSANASIKDGKLKWSVNGIAKENGTIHYETNNFKSKDGAYASLDMKLDVLVDIMISGSNSKLTTVFAHASAQTDTAAVFGYSKNGSTEQVFTLPECEIPVAGPVKVGVKFYVVASANGEFTVEATANLKTNNGILYHDGEFETWDIPTINPSAKADADGKLEVGPGIDATVKIDCGNDFFMNDLDILNLGAEVGIGINGNVDVKTDAQIGKDGADASGSWFEPDENGIIHDCYACFFGDVYVYSKFKAGLGDELNEIVKDVFGKEANVESPKYTTVVTPWHFSVGGTQWQGPEFALKKCEHKLYQTDISVVDSLSKEPISGAKLTVEGHPAVTLDSNGKTTLYLKKGTYNINIEAEDYEAYTDSFKVYEKKNNVEIPMNEKFTLTVRSSNIAEYNGITYVVGKKPNGLTPLPIKPAKYDYICGIAFYNDRLYYACKESGTSDYASAIYSCNPDGSDLKLLVDAPWKSRTRATSFLITDNKLYYYFYDNTVTYYDLKTDSLKDLNLSSNTYNLLYANGNNVYYETYSKAGKHYNIYRKNIKTGADTKISTTKYWAEYKIVPADNGDIFYSPTTIYNREIMRKRGNEDVVIYNAGNDAYVHVDIEAVIGNSLYYSYRYDDIEHLYKLDLTTGQTEMLDSHKAAGSSGYFNW